MPTAILAVVIGYTTCTITTSDATSIACTLEYALMAGTWTPQITDSMGLFPLAEAIVGVSVDLSVTSVSPDTGLNPAGGDLVTIIGAGFAASAALSLLDVPAFSVRFDDGTVCDVTSSASTQMECTTGPFDPEFAGRRRGLTTFSTVSRLLEVSMGSLAGSLPVALNASPYTVASITPSSASPILTKTLTIAFGASYPSTGMATDTFAAALIP